MTGLADIYADWIRRYKLDGFRIDTARHVNATFFRLVPRILAAARAAGVPDPALRRGLRREHAPTLVPFVLTEGCRTCSTSRSRTRPSGSPPKSPAAGLVTRLGDDDYFRLADGVAPTPPTFLGNHDMGRAGAPRPRPLRRRER